MSAVEADGGAAVAPVGAIEIGGSHVAAALVDADAGRLLTPIERRPLDPAGARDEIIGALLSAARAVAQPAGRRWGVATPGPFDYAAGVSRIRGVAKLDALYGTDLRAVLAGALAVAPPEVRFINDADAFLLGEAWRGAARGAARAMAITLGTGLGSAFLIDGRIVDRGAGVPPEGRLDLVAFRGGPVEERISARALRRAHAVLAPDRPAADVADIAARARGGEDASTRVFTDFGSQLGEFIAPRLAEFEADCLVIGGSIAGAWDLFGAAVLDALGEAVAGGQV
ncbi:MAG TPA: ROK family protein, partial [Candidatus Limnocylindria bacterium]|nr:ROK family protein [Candidatus Limnocylindria bacterium]